MTHLQERDDLDGLFCGEGFHGGGCGKSNGVWMCLHHVKIIVCHMTY